MHTRRPTILGSLKLLSLGSLALPLPALAQVRGLDLTWGAWAPDTVAIVWSVGYFAPIVGPLGWGAALHHLEDRRAPVPRTLTGGELSLALGRDGSGLYGVAAAGLGLRHDDGSLDAHWSAGAGVAARPIPFLSLGLEARYRVEDQEQGGFWHRSPADRSGVTVSARVAVQWFSRRGPGAGRPGSGIPSAREAERAARARGVSPRGSALASDVVATALDAMGTPYRWGGGGADGYDCSGLIQFSYGEHGIILPRTSREQARLGMAVERRPEVLIAGDILGFAVDGPGVSHVGLYLGRGQFIHSASQGVKVSSLVDQDPDSRWWRQRWITARRIIR